ncbi:hypothetical protein [Nocardioides plantarum]|uniref:Lipoprotein n=1 Tax=Nocardioides plantarum TaxID=29299 RepID=A0ABV5KAD7_9ACTN|nr:hypothetical protein [Nocardioides plantarum]
MRAGVGGFLLALALSSCGGGVGLDLPTPTGEYADYLAMREAARDRAALLARGLADALGGAVGTIDGDPLGCDQQGGETVAFTYVVVAAVDAVRATEVRPVVEQVLRAQGWTSVESRPAGGTRAADAAYAGISVEVSEGGPGDDGLVLQTSGECFAVPAEHRREVRGDLGDERIEVP